VGIIVKNDAGQVIAKLVEGLSKEQLVDFLIEYSERDSKLVDAISVRFGMPEFKTELTKMERKQPLMRTRRTFLSDAFSWQNWKRAKTMVLITRTGY